MTDLLSDTSFTSRSKATTSTLPRPTGSSTLATRAPSAPTPISALLITADARDLVSKVRVLSSDIETTHSDALAHEMSVRTQQHAKTSPQAMLSTLGDLGFSWRGLARLLGVSVPAIQKWRRGEGVTGENRRKIAALLAGLDVIASQLTVEEIESWFETPISDLAPVTPIDMWADGEYLLVLRYASGELTGDATLDGYEPAWRERWRSDFVAFRGDDGNVSIGRRS